MFYWLFEEQVRRHDFLIVSLQEKRNPITCKNPSVKARYPDFSLLSSDHAIDKLAGILKAGRNKSTIIIGGSQWLDERILFSLYFCLS